MEKNNMTAVEWFYQKIRDSRDGFTFEELSEWRQQAKEMDKKQKIEFAKFCLNKAKDTDIRTAHCNVEEYYKNTYPKH